MKIKFVVVTCLSFLSISIPSFASDNDVPPGGNTVLLEVDGTKLTLSDFDRKRPTALFQARNAFYEAEKKAVEPVC